MEWSWSFLLYSLVIFSLTFLLHLRKPVSDRLPPGPPGWPALGNLFDLGTLPHRSLAGLRNKYGPVVWLRLGSVNTMAVLTANAAAELFKNHDQSFADRNTLAILESHGYRKASLAMAPHGAYWRVLRKLCAVEFSAVKRINETAAIRRRCVDFMLSWIDKEVEAAPNKKAEAHPIQVIHLVFLATFNMVGNLMFSRDLVDPRSRESSELFSAMTKFFELTGKTNVADIFRCLKWLDLQGLRRKTDRKLGRVLSIISGFVKERMKERGEDGKRRKDFLDVLLDFEGNGKDEPAKLSEHQICIFILEIFLAGTETANVTVEWAMTELLRKPETMTKVKANLAKVVGPNTKMEETHIDHLEYLQAVVKETFRLHPPGPLLLPRKAVEDVEFMGYRIPKNTQVLVNAWAIGRDPERWDDPLSFDPERFVGSKIDCKGQHFELLPFGAGRRICAGGPLGQRMLYLLLGSLIHEFDWEVAAAVNGGQTMDMREKNGLAVGKLEPLLVIPKKAMVGRSCD